MEDDRRKETRTVTLEITQREAEKVMVASRLERLSLSLSLSLRSLRLELGAGHG